MSDVSDPIELDDVGKEVKKLLLTYPSLFQNRLDALTNIFTTSNHRWTGKGRMVSDDSTPPADAMCYDDIEMREAHNAESMARGISALDGLDRMRAFELASERKRRDEIASNIDIVASYMPSMACFSYESMQNMNLTSECLSGHYLGGAPFGSIDPAWLKAAEEFIGILRYSFNVVFNLHYDKPTRGETAPEPSMFSQMPASFQKLHADMEMIDERLNTQSGRRERTARLIAGLNMDELIAKVTDPSNDPPEAISS